MKQISRLVLVLFALCSSPVLYAETLDALCQQQQLTETVIVFGNGIMSTEDDAQKSLNRLRRLLYVTLPPEEFSKLEFNLAYNESYGFLRDLYEAAKQKLGSDNAIISFWRWTGDWSIMPDSLQIAAKELAVKFDFSTQVASEDLATHVAFYRASIAAGKSVQVDCHSQGCLFANAAYKKLFEGDDAIPNTKSFGIVAVATPASYVAGGGPHTTLVEDAVIAAISIATLKGILPPLYPNITNIWSGATTSDFKGHSYLDEYTATGSRTVENITGKVVDSIFSLQQSTAVTSGGIITITASWDNPFDVQHMMVVESGISGVVDENNPNGVYGYFTTSTDPFGVTTQRYVVSCETLGMTAYTAFVYNFQHSATSVSVQIEAGSIVRNYEVSFLTSSGILANSLPIAHILAYEDEEGNVQFNITDVGLLDKSDSLTAGEF